MNDRADDQFVDIFAMVGAPEQKHSRNETIYIGKNDVNDFLDGQDGQNSIGAAKI